MKSVRDFNVENKRILVRCDFNVPLDSQGNILDDFKIRSSLPTIQYLLEHGAQVIAMTHLGDGKESLEKVQKRFDELMGSHVQLLENLRANKGEVENDLAFAQHLATMGDIYINDAFAECHRDYASIASVPKYLPHGAGLLLEKEIANLSQILDNPKKPMVAIIGGAKVATKAKFIDTISEIADWVLVSGLIKKEAELEGLSFPFPEKVVAPKNNLEALDIDEETLSIFKEKIKGAKTVIWNGPFGKFEDKEHKKGTLEIANAIIESGAFSVVGGGQTIEFLHQEGILAKFSHASTGGGAMLAYLAGDELPGLEALKI